MKQQHIFCKDAYPKTPHSIREKSFLVDLRSGNDLWGYRREYLCIFLTRDLGWANDDGVL